ncbi:hypothetical protein HII28_05330 [Planctomonas sp. JC2975]|uniref:DUF6069 family protein n=1 Tax=Planctomonas sp. JC2975 TaxID=2729626 RepID=UPI0014731574|nr:DUF6069 family protein [Planctomonas sp. JC2975]NNC11300.1 hypothetical protein [Planctomonas sp. JC2975]
MSGTKSASGTARGADGGAARILTRLGIDWPLGTRQPSWWRFLIATAVAIGGSLLACRLLVVAGESVFPSTVGYGHFAFADYAKLTVVGVLLACLAWPVVTLVAGHAARLFFWLTVIVTVVSFAPDVWVWHLGQAADGVFVLAVMHVAVAVVTYPALVLIAPQRDSRARVQEA